MATAAPAKNIGHVVQVIGPVVDVEFESENLPELYNALELMIRDDDGEHKVVVEVQQHVGRNQVRAVAMSSTDSVVRGMEVVDTGSPITVPVGTAALGRILNVLGDPIDNGAPAVTVTSERLRHVIGSDGATLYYLFERSLVDGRPEFEIRAAKPENGPFRVLARIPASRVPIWQIVNPALSPDGKWLAQPLTDGATTNLWALSTSTGEWKQITDFAERPTFFARRVSWSSDGRFIFGALGAGESDIVLLEGLVGRSGT